MFKSVENKGFQITFQNGYTISCQFGAINYCERRRRRFEQDYKPMEEMSEDIISSSDCEVAIWDSEDNWITSQIMEAMGIEPTEEMIQAYVPADEVAKIIEYLYKIKPFK